MTPMNNNKNSLFMVLLFDSGMHCICEVKLGRAKVEHRQLRYELNYVVVF